MMIRVLHDMLYNASRHFPNKEAVLFKDENMSFVEITALSESLASSLTEFGVRKGDRVAFFLEKRFEKVIAVFGISLAGAVFVPIRRLLQPSQVAHILNDCGAKILITTDSRIHDLSSVLSNIPTLKVIISVDGELSSHDKVNGLSCMYWSDTVGENAPFKKKLDKVNATDLAAILYTSGSTGQPKGVVLSHTNIVAGAQKVSEYLKITRDDRILSILTFSFDYGLNQLTSAFLHGAQIVLLEYLFPQDILRAVSHYDITGLPAVSTTWLQLLQLQWDSYEGLSNLRYVSNTGGAIPENYVRELCKRLPDTEIYLMYGLTEAFRSTYLDPSLVEQYPDSIGKAIPGEEIMVLDEKDRPVGPGETGELVHRGILVAKGYWNDPEKTAERFKPNPLQPKEVQLKEIVVYSGDTVRIDDDGFLFFIGRKDEMIKTAGNRVSPTEVEEVIYASNKFSAVIVMGIPHEIYGQAIKAILVPKSGVEMSAEDLQLYCREHLAPYMIPHSVEYRKELPITANGKLDRASVKKDVMNELNR